MENENEQDPNKEQNPYDIILKKLEDMEAKYNDLEGKYKESIKLNESLLNHREKTIKEPNKPEFTDEEKQAFENLFK